MPLYKIFRRCLISRYIKKVDSRVKNCYCQKKNQKSVFICNFYTYAIFVTWNILETSCPIRYTYSAKKYGAHSCIDFAAHWARATSRDARRGRERPIYWLPWRHRGDSIPLNFYPHKFHCDKFWRYRCRYAYCGMKYLLWFFYVATAIHCLRPFTLHYDVSLYCARAISYCLTKRPTCSVSLGGLYLL